MFTLKIVLFITSVLMIACTGNKLHNTDELSYQDYIGSPAEELVKAVISQNETKIKAILTEDIKLAYYMPNYGRNSPLCIAVELDKYKSVKTILEMGVSPDSVDIYGKSPFTLACMKENSVMLKLILGYSPNINKVYFNYKGEKVRTPIYSAVEGCVENVKILIEKGADTSYKLDDLTLLGAALCNEKIRKTKYHKIEIVHYLLLKLRVDFEEYKTRGRCLPSASDAHRGLPPKILFNFRHLDYPLDSREYQLKMECVEYLKQHGLDYWKEPIPNIIKHIYKDNPDYLKEY